MKDNINYFFFFSVIVVPIVIFFIVFFITKQSLKRKLSLAIIHSALSLFILSTAIYILYIDDASFIDIFGNMIFFGSVSIPVVVFWMTMVTTKGRSLITRLLIAFFFSIASFIFIATLWFAITFRDGLGPDSTTSYGSEALIRSIEDLNIYGIIFSFAFFFLGFFLKKFRCRSPLKNSDKNLKK